MLTASVLGMALYGAASVLWPAWDVVRGAQLEWWAELGLVIFGALLIVSAALVRVRMPGGLSAAVGALLGLQALSVHNAVHLEYTIPVQILQGLFAACLVVMADAGAREPAGREEDDAPLG